VAIKIIPVDKLYHGYKPGLREFMDKYFRHEGNPLLWINTPICMFACEYVNKGRSILDTLDTTSFIRYEYERYFDAETVKNDTHKLNAAKRVMKIVDSIRKHGYAKGKYKHKKHLINVARGFVSPWGDDPGGYSLIGRKHRAAACVALGMTHIKVKVLR
jgi:hypothetical protein